MVICVSLYMKKESWPVTKKHLSLIGNTEKCTYCNSKENEEHDMDCVQRKRTVIIEMKINIAIEVPEHWGEEMINFHKNESSWCADNILDDLKRMRRYDGCLCSQAEFKYINEASESEHNHYKLFKLK